jgi:hypothetical protein
MSSGPPSRPRKATPVQAAVWALTATFIALFARVVGESILPHQDPFLQFVLGLLALWAAGCVGADIAERLLGARRRALNGHSEGH